MQLVQIKRESVLTELRAQLSGLDKDDVIYTSGRYGFNVNALFLHAIKRGLANVAENLITVDNNRLMRDILHEFYREHFTSDYRTFKIAQTKRAQLQATGQLVPELQPPTPVHASPRGNANGTAKTSSTSLEVSTTAASMTIPRAQDAYLLAKF